MDLSIIVPVYNVADYLPKCLKSLLALKDIDKEIILVNDGSTDNSFEIMEKFKNDNKNVIKIITQDNMGLSEARNSGLKIATGKYIYFIDSDDYIDTKKFEIFFTKTKQENLDIGIANGYREYENGKLKKIYIGKENKIILNGDKFLEYCIKNKMARSEVCLKIYNNKFLKKNNLFFEKKLIHEDMLYSVISTLKACRVKYYDIYFYYYFQRKTSISNTKTDKNDIHKLYIINKLLEYKIDKKYFNRMSIAEYFKLKLLKGKYNQKIEKDIYKLKNLYLLDRLKVLLIHILKNKNNIERLEI